MKLELDLQDETKGWKEAGSVSIETGQIMITDPCQVGDKKKIDQEIDNLFVEFTDFLYKKGLIYPSMPHGKFWEILAENEDLRIRFGEICASTSGDVSFVSLTGFGDGTYPVYVKLEELDIGYKRVVGIWIDFMCGRHHEDES